MSYKIVLSDSAYNLGILNPAACLISNIKTISTAEDDEGRCDALDIIVANIMNQVKSSSLEMKETPQARGFRKLFQNMGYEDQTPAGERLLNGALERGLRRYDNIIDAYNVAALKHVAGLGMHDAANLSNESRPLTIWRSEGTDKILPLTSSKKKKVKEGDLVYGFKGEESNIVAWLGKRDVDSKEWSVTDATTSLFFMVLGNMETSYEDNEKICTEVYETIKLTCPEADMEILPIERE